MPPIPHVRLFFRPMCPENGVLRSTQNLNPSGAVLPTPIPPVFTTSAEERHAAENSMWWWRIFLRLWQASAAEAVASAGETDEMYKG